MKTKISITIKINFLSKKSCLEQVLVLMPVFHILLLTELDKSGLTMNNLRASVSRKEAEPLCIIIILIFLYFLLIFWYPYCQAMLTITKPSHLE